MDKPALTFVAEREAEAFAPLAERIRTLGYQPRAVIPSAWCLQDATPAVVLCQARATLDALAAALCAPKRPPLLAVFGCTNGRADSSLLRRCDDFIGWPCQDDELSLRLDRLTAGARPGNPILNKALLEEFLSLNMIGRSPAFLAALATLTKIASCDAPVAIEGETGTGKEMAARAIHYLGARRDQPFIPVNCGALPDGLIESELFGHARGAFTDARAPQTGLVAQADTGTLFLDEVDALSPKAQVTLLRFLQDRVYRPVGDHRFIQADVRVIAACNLPLEDKVAAGQFREDLLYRLNIMQLRLPPLRERHGDAILLARHFLDQYRVRYNQASKYLPATGLPWLETYPWPGNVRELENLMHRQFLLADGDTLNIGACARPSDVSHERRRGADRRNRIPDDLSFNDAKASAVRQFERGYLQSLLVRTHGNITQAARLAGKERRALGKLLKKHDIDTESYRA